MPTFAAVLIAIPMTFGLCWYTPLGGWFAEIFDVGEDSPVWLRVIYLGPEA